MNAIVGFESEIRNTGVSRIASVNENMEFQPVEVFRKRRAEITARDAQRVQMREVTYPLAPMKEKSLVDFFILTDPRGPDVLH